LLRADETNLDHWTLLSNAFADSVPLHLAIDGGNDRHLALTTHKSELLESLDGGATWRPFASEKH
jgi:hypothetical protein